jgi:hypothetical protein
MITARFMNKNAITCLACGVFKKELEFLSARGQIDFRVHTLESMLHMDPAKLQTVLETITAGHPQDNYLLLYGDCQPRMNEMSNKKNTARISGVNCCEILLGKEAYRKLQLEKAFIFLPEWAQRWREIFTRELGFGKAENAKMFMKDHLEKLVYIDTGILPVPVTLLKEIQEFFDLPLEVVTISLEILKSEIEKALQKFNPGILL